MFSFFRKKSPFTVVVKEFDHSRFAAGMEVTTDKHDYRKDVTALQQTFQSKRSLLKEPSNPSGTLVATSLPDEQGHFSYFVGDLVDSSEQEEPAYEVTVDGEKQRVKLSELLSGYQRQADYTRKTQALAEERRQVDAMLAALKVEKQKDAGRAADDKAKPGDIQQEYEAAVREAEKMLGIGAGEFNSFDPQHAFALQKVMMEGASRRTAAQEVQSIVQAFAAEAQKDPMSSAIDAHFNQYLFERGAASPEGGKQAARIAEAQGRFMRGQATRADCDVLKEHWEYVRGKLKAQTVPKKEEKVVQDVPVPPKTETPGTGRGTERRAALDVHKLGRMTAGQQLAALKRAGVLSMPK